jgi:hypothetical protein
MRLRRLMPTTQEPSHRRIRAQIAAIASLCLLFLWVYGRFAFALHFVMDDFIHSAVEMTGPLGATLRDTFAGIISWSGYRPLSTAFRVILTHAFGLERMWGYYVVYLSLHLINTLLAYRLVWRVSQSTLWAFFAAAVVLLLPSHNEAVFWFAATSNVLALFFALVALDFALTATERPGLLPAVGAAAAYACAVLAYEVTLGLPVLILAADWIRNGHTVRRRVRLYILFGITALLLLAMRLAVQAGSLLPVRSDYAVNLDPSHLLRGFLHLFSQMVLLYTSPYAGAPFQPYSRNWLEPASPLAIATSALTLAFVTLTFVLAAYAKQNGGATTDNPSRNAHGRWFLWGLLWMIVMGLAFATLTGRNPENRYTYLLSFGFAVSLTALLAALDETLQRTRPLQCALRSAMAALITFYAFVSVGDATDWAAASAIVRTTQQSIRTAIPNLTPDQAISQIAIPAHLGSAYTYAIGPAFQSAMQLLYPLGQPGFTDHATLRQWFANDSLNPAPTYAFGWNEVTRRVEPITALILCKTYDDCRYFDLLQPDGAASSTLRYLQIYDSDNPQLGGVFLLATLEPFAVLGCHIFQDYNVDTDPAAFWDYPEDQRCEDAVTAFWDFSE